MNASLFHWFSFALALAFLFPRFDGVQAPPGDLSVIHHVYLPWVRNNPPPDMAFVPEGEFQMGCTLDPCFTGSIPVHPVFLNQYYIDKYEVTNDQYAQCVAAGVCASPAAFGSHTRPSYYDNPTYKDFPVIHIAWEDAHDYCEWVGKRLPTEAEWEKAAIGGLDNFVYQYPWGDAAPTCESGAPNGAQYDDCSPDDTVKVGSFGPNGYGIYDMAGNVWDWVNDWWDASYYSNSPYSNPPGPPTGNDKVVRGGGWNYNSSGLRVSDRVYRHLTTPLGNHDVGFRCVFSTP